MNTSNRAAASKQYRDKNKARIAAYYKEWIQANKHKRKEYNKRYYLKCRAKMVQ